MDIEQSVINFDTLGDQKKKLRPQYDVTKDNLIQLLDYYFLDKERGNLNRLVYNLKKAKISLNELEYVVEKIYPFLYKIYEHFDKEPTQTNLLEYAIEALIDINWDRSEKEMQRLIIIQELKNATEEIKKYNHYDEYYTKEENKHYLNMRLGDYVIAIIEYENDNEPSYTDSEHYDDDLDGSEQGGDFWDDVI